MCTGKSFGLKSERPCFEKLKIIIIFYYILYFNRKCAKVLTYLEQVVKLGMPSDGGGDRGPHLFDKKGGPAI